MLIIDRFEDEFAVCENESGEIITIHISKLDESAAVGSVLIADGDDFSVNSEETLSRKQRNISLTEKLRNRLSEKE